MTRILFFVLLVLAAGTAQAQATGGDGRGDLSGLIRSAGEVDPEALLWINRLLVIFANTPSDPRYAQQMEYITERLDALAERDVVVITDTDPAARSALRQRLRPRDFMLVLIGKDNTVYLRKPEPWRVREISRSIDKLPTRQQELRDRRGGS